MSKSTRTSEDFVEFTREELVEELMRRSDAMVVAMLVAPECDNQQAETAGPNLSMSWVGAAHTCHGLADHMSSRMAWHVHKEYGF